MSRLFPIIFLISFFVAGLQSQDQQIDVLFVGNSYTYFHNLPQTVEAMAASRDERVSCLGSTSGGVNLGMHWKEERGLQSKTKIQEGKFEFVVLQDHSMRPVMERDSTLYYGKQLGKLIQDQGATPIVYLTWARKNNPLMQQGLTETYRALAEEIDGLVAPVGLAWKRSIDLRPELDLYDPDGSHPSAIGSYLAACVFYKVITGNSPVGLPSRLSTLDRNGDTVYLHILPIVDTQFCQQIANESVK